MNISKLEITKMLEYIEDILKTCTLEMWLTGE